MSSINQALARLRPSQRGLICTYYGIGRSRVKPGKILQQLGIAKSTLSLRRRLALRALKKMLARCLVAVARKEQGDAVYNCYLTTSLWK